MFLPPAFANADGSPMTRVTINGEPYTYCGGGTRDGSVETGVKGPPPGAGGPNEPIGDPNAALWNPSDYELQ